MRIFGDVWRQFAIWRSQIANCFGAAGWIGETGDTGYYRRMRVCYSCGHELDERLEVFRSTACPGCDRDLKVCKNCQFYSPGSRWDCHESIDESVRDKERGNFCGFFRFRSTAAGGGAKADRQEGPGGQDKAREAFGKLFEGDE